jgi:hypothetical protein
MQRSIAAFLGNERGRLVSGLAFLFCGQKRLDDIFDEPPRFKRMITKMIPQHKHYLEFDLPDLGFFYNWHTKLDRKKDG